MKELYDAITTLPFDGHHFFSNGKPLKDCMKMASAKIVIEVGSWLGASAGFMASQLPPDGVLYAVDTWLGSPEHQKNNNPRIPTLYQQFLSNVKHAGLTEKIIPIRMTSLEAAKALTIKADLIYIDASHDEENVYNDILAWHPHVKPGGILCGDDLPWEFCKSWDGLDFWEVHRAVVRAGETLNLNIHAIDRLWFFIVK